MSELIDNMKDKLSEMTSNLSSLLNKEVLDTVKEYGVEKINETWSQIEGATDVFSRAGYSITKIGLNLSLPPTLSLSLERIEDIEDSVEEQLLEEQKDNKVLYTILVAMFKANALQKSINSTLYKFSGLSIGLGLSPSIEMNFSRV
jgi:divalent metal cation (Fe/Co/Zn/Cd) transporter